MPAGSLPLLPLHDDVSDDSLQSSAQCRSVCTVSAVPSDREIVVDILVGEDLTQRGHGADGEDVLGPHDAKQVICQLDVEGSLKGGLQEGGVQIGLVIETEGKVVEAVVVFGAHVVVHLIGEGNPPLLESFLGIVCLLFRQLVEFIAEELVGHEEAEELVETGLFPQFTAVFVECGGDDLRDKLAIGADVVGQDIVGLEGSSDRMFMQVLSSAFESVVEDAAARVEAGGHADEGMDFGLMKHIGPFLGDEGIPYLLIAGHHLSQVGVVEA